jgi:hypothetical protein
MNDMRILKFKIWSKKEGFWIINGNQFGAKKAS